MIVQTSALTLLLALSVRGAANAPCYFPGGGSALGYYPCAANAYISSCCPAGWTCYSNALCIATTDSNSFPNLTLGAVQRGACTNPNWTNDICGSACLDSDNADGALAACGADKYCCEHDYEIGACNCSSSDAFTISAGLAQTIVQVSDAPLPTGTPSVSIASPITSFLSITTTHNSTSNTASSASNTGSSTGSRTASSMSSSATSTATNASSDDGSHDRNLKLGLGLGIGLGGAAILGALAYFFWRRRRGSGGGSSVGGRQVEGRDHGGQGGGGGGFGGGSLELTEDHLNGPSYGQSYQPNGAQHRGGV
ncbi:hypothetical protein QBC46DRAFT_388728 [Diplogelasinospora grovesii]|uniref:Mid2 domain-containing protein n=1 Tax=Diplogelasinospora grovesii TaxID=303347 RepID=A0AAN6S415_9PEZI|nr:hypothetical protein QBC46DRAFT_388728 [Diplogelasinospora grovesii]